MSRPMVAATARTWRDRSSNPSMSAEIRSDSKGGIASPARCAATSSSVKNGLPLSSGEDLFDQRWGSGAADHGGDPGRDVVAAETTEVDRVDGWQAGELGQTATLRPGWRR